MQHSKRIHSDPERRAPIYLEVGADEDGKIEPSHYARYDFALTLLSEVDTVLDLPCGVGYGSGLLARKVGHVVGCDISEPAITHSKEYFQVPQIEFVVGDAEKLPHEVRAHAPFSKVVSFEGIEHVPHPSQMLREIKSVIASDGKLIISTPRKPHGSPHHIIEFSLDEFTALLTSEGFVVHEVYGQIYTDIFKLSDRPSIDPHTYRRFNYIAVCANV